jgi:hypothetical protein
VVILSQRPKDITREVEEGDIITKMVVPVRMASQKESVGLILSVSLPLKRNNSSVEKLISSSKSCGKSLSKSLRRLRVIRTPNRRLD